MEIGIAMTFSSFFSKFFFATIVVILHSIFTEGFAETYYIWIAYVLLLCFWVYKDIIERKFFLQRHNASKTTEKFKEILTQDIPASVLVVDA